MRIKSAVLRGSEVLSDDELCFLVLVGQLSNELTALHKILKVSKRDLTEQNAQSANAVVIAMFEKLLASKVWQGWELIRTAFHGAAVSSADWLRKDKNLHQHLRAMKRHFPDGCAYETIRNQFGFHYDIDAIKPAVRPAVLENGFSIVQGDKVENSFYLTSEVVTWSSLIGQDEEERYVKEYAALLEDIYARAEDFISFFRLVIQAFIVHVCGLGGSMDSLEEFDVDPIDPSEKIILPLFVA